MKTFCVLLLIGIIAYVESDPHACDKYAANTYPKKKVEGSDEHLDPWYPLNGIIDKPKTQNFLTSVTPSKEAHAGDYCSAITHADSCQAVGHFREVVGHPPRDQDVGAKQLRLQTTYVADTGKGYAMKYEFTLKGINDDDYIFDIDTTKPITVTKIIKDTKKTEIIEFKNIPENIRELVSQPYALFYIGKEFALYMTCDAAIMFVTYDTTKASDETYKESTKAELKTYVDMLIAKIEKHEPAKKDKLPTLRPVITQMDPVYSAHIPAAA